LKVQFIKSLIKTLVGDSNFLLLKNRGDSRVFSENHNILVKEHLGSSIVVELIDGDQLSAGEITARLQYNRRFLTENKPEQGFFIFEIFIFESSPTQDRLTAINTGQFQLPGKAYLKCLSVNLTANTVERHFKVPITDLSLSKTINRLFAEGFIDLVSDNELEELVSKKEAELITKKDVPSKLPLQSKIPVVTYVLIGINILIGFLLFLFSQKSGVSYDRLLFVFGAKDNLRILSGEYWRFLTPIFLHANILHLFINCYSLFAIGVLVEKIFGSFKFAFVYLVAGITGNILSFIFSSNPGVGASGSIFGLLGALLFFGIINPALFKSHFGNNVILTILINLGYGFTNARIDNFAHIGGLIGGFLTSGVVLTSNKKHWYTNPFLYLALTILLTYSGLSYGFNNTQNKILFKINELEQLERTGNWSQTEAKAQEILRLNPSEQKLRAYTLLVLVNAQALSGNYQEAINNAEILKSIDPQIGHYLLGLLYYNTGQYDLARKELGQAKKTGVNEKVIDELLNEIESLGM